MADIKKPVKLKRCRLVKDDIYAERLLEALYRARRLAPERFLTRAELAYFFFNPNVLPATLAELNAALDKAQWAEDTRHADRTLFLLALDTLEKRDFLETDAGASRLHIQTFNQMRKIFQDSTTLPQEKLLERIYPSENVVRKSFESLGWQEPPQRVVDTAERLRQPNNQAGCCLGLLLLLIIVLGGLYVFTRASGENSSIAYAPPEPAVEHEASQAEPVDEPELPLEAPVEAGWIPLDLRQARDANGPVGAVLTLGGLFEQPIEELMPGGFVYGLGPESAYLESESLTSERSNWLMLEVGQANVRRVHLLLNLANSNVALAGQGIGQVELFFSNGERYAARLIAGTNIRDWLVEFPGAINERYEDDAQIEVLRKPYNGFPARIDQVTVEVPKEYWGLVLESIVVEDWSLRDFGTKDPAIVWFGGALEVGE